MASWPHGQVVTSPPREGLVDATIVCLDGAMKKIDFVERRATAAAAKKQLIEKMRQAPKSDDPAVIASRAEKARAKVANAVQRAERSRLAHESDVRQKAEDDARAAAEAIAAKAELDAAAERSVAEEAERKTERDRRYAARKIRNR